MNLSSKTGKRWLAAWTVAAALALASPGARAQNGSATVSAGLLDASVEAGQSTQYQIKVTDGVPRRIPLLAEVNGLTLSYPNVGQSESNEMVIGPRWQQRHTFTFTFTYRVDTTRPGQFVIPEQSVDVGGTTLHTMPVTLTVLEHGTARKGSPGLWLTAELNIPKRSAYVGESIPVEYRALFGLAMRFEPDPDPTLQGEGFSLQKFTRPQIDLQTVQGVQVHAANYKSTIAGAKIGRCTVGPAEVQPAVQAPWSPRQIFIDPKDYQLLDESLPMVRAYYMPQKRVKLTSGTVDVEIKPLPPGKPAAFSGAIGEFKLEAEADPRKAQAGDPVTVRLLLSGRGNFDRAAPPVLSDARGLRTYPATSRFKADDDVNLSGVKTFEQVVIADGPRSTLPSYHFSYLDPGTGKYVEMETLPIPVEIIGGGTPAPLVAGATPVVAPMATPTPFQPPKPAEDILYIRTDPGPEHGASDFLPLYRRGWFWAAQGGVGAGVLGLACLGAMRARGRDEDARRRARVHRRQVELERVLGREETSRGEFYSAAAQLARLRAAAAAGRPSGSLSGGPVEEIFHRHDELAYSGVQVAAEPVPADERRDVLAVLRSLDKP